MAQNSKLEFIIPGLFWPRGIEEIYLKGDRPAVIERMLTCSNRELDVGQGMSEILFSRFGINKRQARDFPIGAVSLVGRGINSGSSCWAKATPVHLLTDKDSVILIRINPLDISRLDAEFYVQLFNEHFNNDGLHLLLHAHNEWYLKIENCPNLSTTEIESVAGRCIFDYLPRGQDGKKWRGYLNEAQMLFHQAKIGSAQAFSGDNGINAIWFSGVGYIPAARARYSATYSNHPLLTGLAILSEISTYPISHLQNDSTLPDGDVLVLFDALMESTLDGDVQGWINALFDIDSLIKQLLNINKKSTHKDIVLYSCDGAKFEVKNGCFRRGIWPMNKKLGQFLR